MTLKTEEAIKIAEQIHEDILHNEEASTLTILRQYYSLVTLLKKEDEVEWALNELNGYILFSKVPNYRRLYHPKDKRKFVPVNNSCGILQYRLQNNETYTYKCIKHPRISLVTKKEVYADYPRSKIDIKPKHLSNILLAIKNRIYIKTNHILLEIKFGKFEFDIFEETRKVVDTELSKKYPKAFEKLTEAYEGSIKSESPLAFQQTAHACRVVLKDFADAVFPVSNKKTFIDLDGKSHPIKDDDYINRIIACVQENTDSKSDREFIKNSLIYLGNFLKSINDLASIGTHHEITKEDANRCLIYTYLVLGDVIKLLEKPYAPIGI